MIKKIGIGLLILLFFSKPEFVSAGGKDIKIPSDPSDYPQSYFNDLSKQLGTAISYTPLAPAEPLGVLGFDVGLAATSIDIDEKADFWKKVIPNSTPPGFLFIPKIQAKKGLPFGIDVGVSYATVPDSNVSIIGAELKYAILSGNILFPAVAIRGTYTKLMGIDELDLSTAGVDLSISKGFLFLTPYAGIGEVFIKSSAKSSLKLEDVNTSITKGFAGLKISFLILSLVAEADFAEIPSYSLKAGISF